MSGSGGNSRQSLYKPSDLPSWDVHFFAQGGIEQSTIDFATGPALKSDITSSSFGVRAAREDLRLVGALRYQGFKGSGVNDGQDAEQYGLLFMPGYRVLQQTANGIDLTVYAFLDLSQNDYDEAGNQSRLVPGFGLAAARLTPIGAFQLAYMFSHDRNLDGDTEITGEKYININNFSLKYAAPLTRNLLCTAGLSALVVLDVPDAMDNSSSSVHAGLSYTGFERVIVGINLSTSIAGYDHQGAELRIGYIW